MSNILLIGVLVSIIFYEITDITPGGIIIPGLLVLYLSSPLRMGYTVFIAILAYFIVKLLSKKFLIFGKRRFALLIIVSLFLHYGINLGVGLFTNNLSTFAVSLIGYTAAGIIANNMSKQGVIKTSISLAIVIGIIELIIVFINGIGVLV